MVELLNTRLCFLGHFSIISCPILVGPSCMCADFEFMSLKHTWNSTVLGN